MECETTRRFCRSLEAQGALTYPLIAGTAIHGGIVTGAAPPGWPDRLVLHTKWKGFIECKEGKGRLTPLQARIMGLIRDRGFPVWVIRFVPDIAGPLGMMLARIEDIDGSATYAFKWSEILDALAGMP
jgi:hypothetical protein